MYRNLATKMARFSGEEISVYRHADSYETGPDQEVFEADGVVLDILIGKVKLKPDGTDDD